MVVNLTFERPFHGVVFAENRFGEEECRWRGNGGHYLLVVVPLDYSLNDNSTNSKSRRNEKERKGFCGLKFENASLYCN
jgi:hypothetical protein